MAFRKQYEENAVKLRAILKHQNTEDVTLMNTESHDNPMPSADVDIVDRMKSDVEESNSDSDPDEPTVLILPFKGDPEDGDEVNEEVEEDDSLVELEQEEDNDASFSSSPSLLKQPFSFLYLECALCPEVLPHCNAYNIHITDQHMDASNTTACPLCPELSHFSSEATFRMHVYGHTKFRFECPICPSKLGSRFNLGQHLKQQHEIAGGIRFRQCLLCGELHKDEIELRKHLLDKHLDPQQTNCYMCPQSFNSDRLLALHYYSHFYSPMNKFCCELCGRFFGLAEQLKAHLKTHDPDLRYECDVCGKSYKNEQYRDIHRKRHGMQRNLKCEDCGKMFYMKRELKAHRVQHSEANRSYVCEYCNRGFLNSSVRDEHIRIRHTFERRFPCDQCQRSYYRRRELVEHQRSHTGEKPFNCELCGRVYARKTTLMTHMKTHRGEEKKGDD